MSKKKYITGVHVIQVLYRFDCLRISPTIWSPIVLELIHSDVFLNVQRSAAEL